MSIVGIAIGIATIVALGLITGGMESSVQTSINEGSAAEITVMNNTSDLTVGSAMLDESLVDELAGYGNVSQVAGMLSVSQQTSSGPQQPGPNQGSTIYGIDPDKIMLAPVTSIDGDVYENGTYEAVIGQTVADNENLTIGDNIEVNSHEFEIVGIYDGGSVMTSGNIYVPLDTLQNIAGTDEVSQILIKTNENANDTVIAEDIEYDYDDLATRTSEQTAEMLSEILGILDTASLAISLLAIIVGGIGIINTMIMTVYERTKEIGVLKSVGWKSRRILTMIMGETLVLTILSAIVGSVGGIVICEVGMRLISDEMPFSLGYDINTFLLAFGIAIIVGIIGGLYPAYKASKLAPTEALRYE